MISEEALLADLAATYPGLDARPLRAHGGLQGPGAWFTNCISMPDGKPIYMTPDATGHVEPEGYSFWLHDGFQAWLESRGWYIETYDYGSYLIVPLPALEGQACGE